MASAVGACISRGRIAKRPSHPTSPRHTRLSPSTTTCHTPSMTNPTATTEPRTERRGGARPGAGAPRRNRNAARKTPREAALDVFAGVPLRDIRRALPPAIGTIFTMALARAVETALDETEAQTRHSTPRKATSPSVAPCCSPPSSSPPPSPTPGRPASAAATSARPWPSAR